MSELSREMQVELINGIQGDVHSMNEAIIDIFANSVNRDVPNLSYTKLEHMVYITEQIRLKLKMLGAPRIGW